MKQVNMFEAKTDLSKLIRSLEDKEEDEIIIARSGVPVAKIIPFTVPKKESIVGIAKGKFVAPDDIDFCNDEILEMFDLKE